MSVCYWNVCLYVVTIALAQQRYKMIISFILRRNIFAGFSLVNIFKKRLQNNFCKHAYVRLLLFLFKIQCMDKMWC